MASNTRHNISTGATDLFVTFGYEKSEHGGWASVGLGSGMYGALMFVTYAPESSNDGEYFPCMMIPTRHRKTTYSYMVRSD